MLIRISNFNIYKSDLKIYTTKPSEYEGLIFLFRKNKSKHISYIVSYSIDGYLKNFKVVKTVKTRFSYDSEIFLTARKILPQELSTIEALAIVAIGKIFKDFKKC